MLAKGQLRGGVVGSASGEAALRSRALAINTKSMFIIFGFVAKPGPGSVAIVFGMDVSSNLAGSNLKFIDYNA